MVTKENLIALAEQLEEFGKGNIKEVVQDSAAFVFIKRGAKLLTEGGIPMDLAEEAMLRIQIQLNPNLHKQYSIEFQRIVEGYANLLIGIYWALVEDFVHPRTMFLNWAAQCEFKSND